MPVAKGSAVHGEFSSSNASSLTEPQSRITLYGPASTSAVTLGASDYVVVTDVVITTGTSLTVTIFDGADATPDAGEVIYKGTVNGTAQFSALLTPHYCQVGTWPHVKTSGSGQVDVVLRGTLTTNL